MNIYSQSETFDLLTSFNLGTSHAHESVSGPEKSSKLFGRQPLFTSFPLLYPNSIYKWFRRVRGPAAMQAIGGTGEKMEKKEKTIFLEQVECC